jgi:hypothetical protein
MRAARMIFRALIFMLASGCLADVQDRVVESKRQLAAFGGKNAAYTFETPKEESPTTNESKESTTTIFMFPSIASEATEESAPSISHAGVGVSETKDGYHFTIDEPDVVNAESPPPTPFVEVEYFFKFPKAHHTQSPAEPVLLYPSYAPSGLENTEKVDIQHLVGANHSHVNGTDSAKEATSSNATNAPSELQSKELSSVPSDASSGFPSLMPSTGPSVLMPSALKPSNDTDRDTPPNSTSDLPPNSHSFIPSTKPSGLMSVLVSRQYSNDTDSDSPSVTLSNNPSTEPSDAPAIAPSPKPALSANHSSNFSTSPSITGNSSTVTTASHAPGQSPNSRPTKNGAPLPSSLNFSEGSRMPALQSPSLSPSNETLNNGILPTDSNHSIAPSSAPQNLSTHLHPDISHSTSSGYPTSSVSGPNQNSGTITVGTPAAAAHDLSSPPQATHTLGPEVHFDFSPWLTSSPSENPVASSSYSNQSPDSNPATTPRPAPQSLSDNIPSTTPRPAPHSLSPELHFDFSSWLTSNPSEKPKTVLFVTAPGQGHESTDIPTAHPQPSIHSLSPEIHFDVDTWKTPSPEGHKQGSSPSPSPSHQSLGRIPVSTKPTGRQSVTSATSQPSMNLTSSSTPALKHNPQGIPVVTPQPATQSLAPESLSSGVVAHAASKSPNNTATPAPSEPLPPEVEFSSSYWTIPSRNDPSEVARAGTSLKPSNVTTQSQIFAFPIGTPAPALSSKRPTSASKSLPPEESATDGVLHPTHVSSHATNTPATKTDIPTDASGAVKPTSVKPSRPTVQRQKQSLSPVVTSLTPSTGPPQSPTSTMPLPRSRPSTEPTMPPTASTSPSSMPSLPTLDFLEDVLLSSPSITTSGSTNLGTLVPDAPSEPIQITRTVTKKAESQSTLMKVACKLSGGMIC